MYSLKKMLVISRNIILEREFLLNLQINPHIDPDWLKDPSKPYEIKAVKIPALDEQSPFLVTKSINNRSTLVLYKVMIKKGL